MISDLGLSGFSRIYRQIQPENRVDRNSVVMGMRVVLTLTSSTKVDET